MVGSLSIQQVTTILKNLFKILSGKSVDSTQELSKNVKRDETLSSFVFRSEQVVKKSRTIHYSRLVPRRNPTTGRLETSVCRSEHLSDEDVWKICTQYFDTHAPKPAIGRGVGPAEAVYKVGLNFDADGIPYREHANIIGWHDGVNIPDSEQKHYWMDQSQRMAPSFSYLPRVKAE